MQKSSHLLSGKPIQNPEALQVVDLSHNRLDKLPSCLKQLVNLRTLHLNDNFFKELDYSILEEFKGLESLIARNNLLC